MVEGMWESIRGRCSCGALRYQMTDAPLIVHACHCSWCQRETGSAFAVNALIESARVVLIAGEAGAVTTPSESGKGQEISRCIKCRVAVWSHYSGLGDAICFVRVGTLDQPDRCPPDIHIFTASRQPWFDLPHGMLAVPAYYRASEVWSSESLARRRALREAEGRQVIKP